MASQNSFYSEYESTHINGRKRRATSEYFEFQRKKWLRDFGPYFPKEKQSSILDIGCGTGSLLYCIQKEGYINSFGIDLSLEQVNIGSAIGVLNLSCQSVDSFFASYHGSPFSVVIMRDVLEHVPVDEVVGLLTKIRDNLENGGNLLIQVPNAQNLFWGLTRHGDYTHHQSFTENSLRQLSKVVGFRNCQILPVEPQFNGVRGLFKRWKYKFIKYLINFAITAERPDLRNRITSMNIFAILGK